MKKGKDVTQPENGVIVEKTVFLTPKVRKFKQTTRKLKPRGEIVKHKTDNLASIVEKLVEKVERLEKQMKEKQDRRYLLR